MIIKDYIGVENIKALKQRLEEITDVYKDVCKKCVLKVITKTLNDAERKNLLAKADKK